MPEGEGYSYESDDRYVYSGTDVLVNLFGIRNWKQLSEVERSISGVRYAELEESPIPGDFDHLRPCASK